MRKRGFRAFLCCVLVVLLLVCSTAAVLAAEARDGDVLEKNANGRYYIPVAVTPGVTTQSQGGTKYTVAVDNLPGASSVLIPTWSQENGQDDIVWYAASNHGNGIWVAAIDAARHGGGTMISHVYADNVRVGSTTYVTPVMAKPYATAQAITSTRYKITAYNLGAATKVQVPTWSDQNGQDDIVWLNATNDGGGVWSTYVDTVPHGGGLMYSHVYVDGQPVASVSYTAPYTQRIAVTVEPLGGSRFKITATNLSWATKVTMPTWSEADGRDDIAWYVASRNGDGSWSAVIDANRHGGGLMHTHVYADDKPVGSASFLAPDVPEVSVTAEHLGGTRYRIIVHNLSWPTQVLIPTWSEQNGQDDIAWYQARYDGYGTWTAVVDAGAHGGGYMMSHVYADGRPVGSVTYVADYVDRPTVQLEPVGGSKYRVIIRSLPHATNVQIPVWNQLDGSGSAIWYKGAYVGNGVWTAVINAADLGPGRIITHVYADGRLVGQAEAIFQYTT